MNFFEEYYRSFSKRISGFAYDFRVESNGAFVCEYVTETFVHITGYPFEGVNAQGHWLSLVYPNDIPILEKQLDCLLSGQSNVSEFRIITKSDEIRWLRNYAYPAWGEIQGRVIRIYGTAQESQNRCN